MSIAHRSYHFEGFAINDMSKLLEYMSIRLMKSIFWEMEAFAISR